MEAARPDRFASDRAEHADVTWPVPREPATPKELKRARRALWGAARVLTPYVAARVGEHVYLVATNDARWQRQLFVKQTRTDIKILANVMKRFPRFGIELPHDPVFVDVGANIGTTTISALREHGFVRGVAIEPAPETFKSLRVNLILNDVEDRVEAVQAAASDRDGELDLGFEEGDSGRGNVAAEAGSETVRVPAVTLDTLVAHGTIDPAHVGMLWIDGQGHEPSILAGATSLLERGVPMVASFRSYLASPADTVRLANTIGPHYSAFADLRRTSQRLHPIERLHETLDARNGSTDFLLVRT